MAETDDFPTVAEILVSEHLLSSGEVYGPRVVKVRNFAVKYGPNVTRLEVDNMKFISTTDVPVAKYCGSIIEPDRIFIIVEFVEGESFYKALPSLSQPEKQQIFTQIQAALITLRSLSPPDYLGSVEKRAFGDGMFFTDEPNPLINGPFANEDDIEGISRRLAEECDPSHVNFPRKVMQETLRGHKTVFTHADFQPKNIMVLRKPSDDGDRDGTTDFEIKVIDWEMSGWYPAYWEFSTAALCGENKPEWLDAVQWMMENYCKEYLMLKLIRNNVFMLG